MGSMPAIGTSSSSWPGLVESRWRRWLKSLACLGLASVAAGTASAQDDAWSFRVTPYLWLPSVSGNAEAGGGIPSIEFDTEVVESLEFGALATFEADYGPWGVLADLIYVDLGAEADTPFGVLFSDVEAEFSGVIFSGYGSYRVVEEDWGDVQLLAGARAFSLDFEATLVPALPALPTLNGGDSETWVNPVAGARLTMFATDELFGGLSADIGGWQGDLTWQAVALVGYRFDETWDVRAGYRYMAVEHEFDGGAELDAAFQGPLIGVGISF
jgi:hypothetical protein